MSNVTEEQKNYIIRFYEMMTAEFIARQLGITRELVYQVAEECNLRKKIKPVSTGRLKVDLNSNAENCILADPNQYGVPFVIDQRTVIMIPLGADPEERRRRFLKRISRATSISEISENY